MNDVKVTLSSIKAATGTGFGYPLIMAHGTAVPYTVCHNLDEVKAAATAGEGDNAAPVFGESSAVYQAARLMLMQDNAPSEFAVFGTDAKCAAALPGILHNGWRQLISVTAGTEGDSTVAEIAAYIGTTDKLYFTDVPAALDCSGFARTVGFYYPAVSGETEVICPVAALVGVSAGKPAGSITYKNQIVKGLKGRTVSAAELDSDKGHKLTVLAKAGDIVISDGRTADGEYIDILDAKDYIVHQLAYKTQQTLNAYDKIPYDNVGISILENVCVNVLQDAYNNGIIATTESGDPAYTVSYGLREETTETDRADRKYVCGSFTATLAGAVHTVEIKGELEV